MGINSVFWGFFSVDYPPQGVCQVHNDLCTQLCFSLGLSLDKPVVQVLMKSDCTGEGHKLHFLTIIVKTCGAVVNPKGREVNW